METSSLPEWVTSHEATKEKVGSLVTSPSGQKLIDKHQQVTFKINYTIETNNMEDIKHSLNSQFIGESRLTTSWLIENMKGISLDQIKSILIELLPTNGFVSQIFRVNLTMNDTENTVVVIKLSEKNGIKDALLKMNEKSSNKLTYLSPETDFERILLPIFNREIYFYKNCEIKGLKLPKIFFSQEWNYTVNEGAIVMEDLSHLQPVSFFNSFNSEQVASVADQLCILHIYSFGTNFNKWRKEFPIPENTCDTLANMTEIVKLFVERNPVLQSQFERLKYLYEDRVFIEMIIKTSHISLGLTDVLCHGDLWTYNMLWETVGTERRLPSSSLGALIDWQNIHTGSIGEDFGHLLTVCCDASTRREIEQQFLSKYWLDLKTRLTSVGISWNVTELQFLRAYRRSFIVHAMRLPFMACVMLSIKSADNEEEQKNRNEALVQRTIEAWSDALDRLREEFPSHEQENFSKC